MEVFWSISDYLRQGGWIMIPLVGVSLVMWTLILDRARELTGLSRGRELHRRLEAAFAAERCGVIALDREILRYCALRLRRSLDARLAVIGVLAGIAPLLGLLGTVLGMIETFEVIARHGTGDTRGLAGGISVALITTQTGLLVAIPGLLMSNRLGRKAQSLAQLLDEATAAMMRRIGREGALS